MKIKLNKIFFLVKNSKEKEVISSRQFQKIMKQWGTTLTKEELINVYDELVKFKKWELIATIIKNDVAGVERQQKLNAEIDRLKEELVKYKLEREINHEHGNKK